MPEEIRYDVFLSHNSQDKPAVEWLARRLTDEAKLRPFLDADVQVRLDFAVLESRLLDNLQDERHYGTNETIRRERACITQELNKLALMHLERSFNDLCKVG